MAIIKKVNINGTIIENYDTITSIRVFNYQPLLLESIDVFIQAKNTKALDYFLNKERIKFQFDNVSDIDYPIKKGNFGDSFSNPITYIRDPQISNNITQALPYFSNEAISKEISFIGGSDNGPYGGNWFNGINLNNSPGQAGDSLLFKIITEDPFENGYDFQRYFQDIIIVIEPSLSRKLEKMYFYYTDSTVPRFKTIGVQYK